MSTNALYTDLSDHYDLMCADIDYQAQSYFIHRLQQVFGNSAKTHLDLACGTGPHIRYFIDYGYQSSGLDINQPMLDKAAIRCPEAQFSLQNMSEFVLPEQVDLITCFLYSIHYCENINKLKACIISAHNALKNGGIWCFNAVDKNHIDNHSFVEHTAENAGSLFTFRSGWHYSGRGEKQSLKLNIKKTTADETLLWHDEHPMVAVSFAQLKEALTPYFSIHVFEHDYEKITPWGESSGNAVFVCVKI